MLEISEITTVYHKGKFIERLDFEDKAVNKINHEVDLTKEQKAIAACMIYGGYYDMAIIYIEGCKEFKRTGKSSYIKWHRY